MLPRHTLATFKKWPRTSLTQCTEMLAPNSATTSGHPHVSHRALLFLSTGVGSERRIPYTYVYINTHAHLPTYMHMCIRRYVYMHTYIAFICVYKSTHTYLHIYIYIYTYMYTHAKV